VAIPHADGVHVVGEWIAAPEVEIDVAGAAPPTFVCPYVGSFDETPCVGTCHEGGSGPYPQHSYALAWTADGTAWLAYVVTRLDQDYTFLYDTTDARDPRCRLALMTDSSTATLHLARVRLDGSPPDDVLTVPIDPPSDFVGGELWTPDGGGCVDIRNVDVRGFGTDLAVGVHTERFDQYDATSPTSSIRVLRIDTTKL
jgi:hypothetical protein